MPLHWGCCHYVAWLQQGDPLGSATNRSSWGESPLGDSSLLLALLALARHDEDLARLDHRRRGVEAVEASHLVQPAVGIDTLRIGLPGEVLDGDGLGSNHLQLVPTGVRAALGFTTAGRDDQGEGQDEHRDDAAAGIDVLRGLDDSHSLLGKNIGHK